MSAPTTTGAPTVPQVTRAPAPFADLVRSALTSALGARLAAAGQAVREASGGPLATPDQQAALALALERDEILARRTRREEERDRRAVELDLLDLPSRQRYAKKLIARIDHTGLQADLSTTLKDRAVALIDGPDGINQGDFGLCGPVAIVRHLLWTDPIRFAELVEDTMEGTDFVLKWMERVDWTRPSQVADHVEPRGGLPLLDFLLSQWLIRRAVAGEVFQQVLGRDAEGRYSERRKQQTWQGADDPSRPRDGPRNKFERQKAFSAGFAYLFDDKVAKLDWEGRAGSFALTAGGVNYLFGRVSRNQTGYKIKVTDFEEDWAEAWARAGQGRGSVLAALSDMDWVMKPHAGGWRAAFGEAAAPRDARGRRLDGKPKMDHWIVITRVDPPSDGIRRVEFWSWAHRYTLDIPEEHLNPKLGASGCFYSFVALSPGRKNLST